MKSKDRPTNGSSDEFPGAAGSPSASDEMVPMDAEAWRRMAHFVADLRHARHCGNALPFENEAERYQGTDYLKKREIEMKQEAYECDGLQSNETGKFAGILKAEEEYRFANEESIRQAKTHALRGQIYMFLDHPLLSQSKWAIRFSIFMSVLIILSVGVIVIEPLTGMTGDLGNNQHLAWFIVECVFTSIFTMELALRLFVCNAVPPNRLTHFVLAPDNWCDFISVLPLYADLALGFTDDSMGQQYRMFRVVRLSSLARIMRVLRLAGGRNVLVNGKAGGMIRELAGPVAMVLTVIWAIYLTFREELRG
jgi:hypothetical protein